MRRVQQSHLPVVAFTHPGMRGKNNEDRYGVSAFVKNDARQTRVLLAILSDGIGGHRAGEVAAEIAVDRISAFVAENGDKVEPPHLLQGAIRTASQAIHEQARTNRTQEGMGATCACVYVQNNRLFTANVGDSRVYLLREHNLRQLTTDHTWIQEALSKGVINPDEVQGHPNAHVIRQFLGSPYPPQVDIRLRLEPGESDSQAVANQGLALERGDILILTTDGLTDLVRDDEILGAFDSMDCDAASRSLIELANQRGGHDNITVIAIRTPAVVNAFSRPRKVPRVVVTGCLALAVVAVLAVFAAWGVYNWQQDGSNMGTATSGPKAIPTQPLAVPPSEGTATPAASPTLPVIPVTSYTPTVFVATRGAATLTPWPTNTGIP